MIGLADYTRAERGDGRYGASVGGQFRERDCRKMGNPPREQPAEWGTEFLTPPTVENWYRRTAGGCAAHDPDDHAARHATDVAAYRRLRRP